MRKEEKLDKKGTFNVEIAINTFLFEQEIRRGNISVDEESKLLMELVKQAQQEERERIGNIINGTFANKISQKLRKEMIGRFNWGYKTKSD